MKSFDIIVPVYNSERFLDKCIDSIRCQTIDEFRLILIDDGSTDSSPMICDRYANLDRRIRVVHQNNKGMILARYEGLVCSDADYILFVDSDDWIENDTIERCLPYMKQDIDVISFAFKVILGHNRNVDRIDMKRGLYDRSTLEKQIFPRLLWDEENSKSYIEPSLCNKIIKRNLYLRSYQSAKELKFNYGEDAAVLFPLMQWIDTFYYIDAPLYNVNKWRDGPADYISNDDFFDLAYSYYCYLREHISEIPNVQKQIEYHYLNFLNARKTRFWNDNNNKNGQFRYIFPFNRIPAKCNIALYGAGAVGQNYYLQIKTIDYCNIVIWVDKYNTEIEHVSNIDKLYTDQDFEYIVVAVKSKALYEEIKCELNNNGIEEEKIIWEFSDFNDSYNHNG